MPIDGLGIDTKCYLVQGTSFEVDKRYKIVQPLRQGAGGVVCSAEDEMTGQPVALKKIESIFEHITMTKRTLRELRILRLLQHENIVEIKNIFIPGSIAEYEDIYVAYELMETDLATTLKSSQPLSDDHCQFFLYQILRGIKYVHSAQVIHRDLKPRNLLVNSNCDLKICDFGLARVHFSDKAGWMCPMTEYVCTRWYRAPEVLCSWTDYSSAIDIWSIGCIFAELLIRKPLYPGHNTQHQLDLIINLLGSPALEELMSIPNEKCRRFIQSLPPINATGIAAIFGEQSSSAQDFLANTLLWDPRSRMSSEDALQHEYLASLHCPEDEPTCMALDTTKFEFERRKITCAALREEIFRETLQYYPDLLRQVEDEQMQLGLKEQSISQFRLLTPGESQCSSEEEDDGAD
mmetsp:Transcript_36892/g.59168  ORF Transcript_36892/g.59168 Transcript_36892/m.59168 type:complete len:406 (-) Transcript_36892:119-1336(-)